MPWKDRSAMDEKASFILEWESGESTVSELCKSFGISRTLAYRYIARYALYGVELPRFGRQVRACGRGNAPVLLFIPNRAFIVQG